MTSTRPSLPLYARDWLADTEVTAMGAVARAGYLDLLCRCWIDGSIPAPDGTPARWAALAALARLTVVEVRKVWPLLAPHFVVDQDGRLRNGRLERHRADADGYSKTKSEAGKKGNAARWGGSESPIAERSQSDRRTDRKRIAERSQSRSQTRRKRIACICICICICKYNPLWGLF